MDEPLASLDVVRKMEVLPFISKLSREVSIPNLYVTHSVDEILNLADRVVLLHQGEIVSEGPVENVMSRFDLSRFDGPVEGGVPRRRLSEPDGQATDGLCRREMSKAP